MEAQKAGKSGPRFIEDLLKYQPNAPSDVPNLLSQVPPVCRANSDGSLWAFRFNRDGCEHNYVLKSNQTKFSMEYGEGGQVSAVCSKCRWHIQVIVANRSTCDDETTPNSDTDHLHHFVYTANHDISSQQADTGQQKENFAFVCSNDCEATVHVQIRSPIINQQFERLLTDTRLIRTRTEEAIAAHPVRLEGVAPYPPVAILDNLRHYLINSIDDPGRPIKADNKRFLASFGLSTGPCKHLLRFFGFSFRESDGVCVTPQPMKDSSIPYQDNYRKFLDDAVEELVCLINLRPASEQKLLLPDLPQLPSLARSDLFSALDAYYEIVPGIKGRFVGSEPFYHDLGAVEDMTASLIVNCFDLQVKKDPTNFKIYLQSLKKIADYRSVCQEEPTMLADAIQNAYSQGKYTQLDVTEAAELFGLRWEGLNHRQVLDKFYEALGTPDLSGHQHELYRSKLRILGEELQSEDIKTVWADNLSEIDYYYAYLGVNHLVDDDFISAAYTAKLIDSPLEKENAERALQAIASARNSSELKKTLAGEMTLADAYQLFGADQLTADDGDVLALYTCCLADYPAQADQYARALEIIGRETNSAPIKRVLGIYDEPSLTSLLPSQDQSQDLPQGPVGLYNIGNTCYLNSLLQFYFSIIPYRELVLNIDQYKMDITNERSLENKQVGSRKVTMNEVKRSLRFLSSLGTLFRDMMNSPGKIYVVPTKELARLTLISPGNEAAMRRRSTISAAQPHGLGEVDGAAVLGPLGPPIITGDSEQQPVEIDSDAYVTIEAPVHPPPVPPRPSPQTELPNDFKSQTIEEAEIEIGAQQDVIEVINNVLFQSHCGIVPTAIDKDGEQVDMIKDLFYGQTRSYISTAKGVRSKDERWCDIKVDVVGGPRDIYAAIDGAFDAQKISVENSEAEQYASITRIPPILQIQIQRAQFDPVTKLAYKSTDHLQLHEVIYMDRYMDSPGESELVDRRRQCWEWKSALAAAEARRNMLEKQFDLHGEYEATCAVLYEQQRLDLDEDLLMKDTEDEGYDSLSGEIEEVERMKTSMTTLQDEEIADLKTKIASQFDQPQFQNLAYRLYAVFVHRGTVLSGHYWLYMFDFRQNIWRKYNDEYVTEVKNTDEIFQPPKVNDPPTSYILVYLNDEKKDLLANPFCRQSGDEATEQEQASSADSPMIDISD